MLTRRLFRRFAFPASAVCLSILSTSAAFAQYKIDLQTCEDLKISKAQYGVNVVETATCINPTKSFKPTVGDQLRLPAGVYSVYIIAWGKRETLEHRGNLTEYFAKMTLTVK